MIVLFCFMLAAATSNVQQLTREVAASGQVVGIAAKPSGRISPPAQIAPGAPPLLAFRYYEGREHHRFTGTELMLDDAGH